MPLLTKARGTRGEAQRAKGLEYGHATGGLRQILRGPVGRLAVLAASPRALKLQRYNSCS